LSTIVSEYPSNILGRRVLIELTIAYRTAVNFIFVKLGKNATKAAIAIGLVNGFVKQYINNLFIELA